MLFIKVMEYESVSRERKRANVIPISKEADKENTLNYKPASLSSMVCKTLEKVTRKQIITERFFIIYMQITNTNGIYMISQDFSTCSISLLMNFT